MKIMFIWLLWSVGSVMVFWGDIVKVLGLGFLGATIIPLLIAIEKYIES